MDVCPISKPTGHCGGRFGVSWVAFKGYLECPSAFFPTSMLTHHPHPHSVSYYPWTSAERSHSTSQSALLLQLRRRLAQALTKHTIAPVFRSAARRPLFEPTSRCSFASAAPLKPSCRPRNVPVAHWHLFCLGSHPWKRPAPYTLTSIPQVTIQEPFLLALSSTAMRSCSLLTDYHADATFPGLLLTLLPEN